MPPPPPDAPSPGSPPEADIAIDLALAASLLGSQHPDLAHFPLRLGAEGWDCMTFRLGDDLALRLPRRKIAARLIEHEQTWLPVLAPSLPIAVPAPIRTGTPSGAYPWRWSIVPWVEGTTAVIEPVSKSEAPRLGTFLRRLHAIPTPADPPVNPYRGGPVSDRAEAFEQRLRRVEAALTPEEIAAAAGVFEAGHRAPESTDRVWLHGDLHSNNVISRDGEIAAIIDWGDICTGDAATDLAAAWILFDPEDHAAFWGAYGPVSETLVARSRAWALAFGLMIWDNHHTVEPAFAAVGLDAVRRVAREAGRTGPRET